MIDRKSLKVFGKEAFKRNYWPSVVVAGLIFPYLVSSTIEINRATSINTGESLAEIKLLFIKFPTTSIALVLIAAIASICISIFINNVIEVGCHQFFLNNKYGKESHIKDAFFGFKHPDFMNIVSVQFHKNVRIFLWTLCFIVPGIIKAYEYYMVSYILAENPSINYKEALELSKNMMNGHKWDAFVLELSFILWDILSIITLAIANILYVAPYRQATLVEFYDSLKEVL